MAWSLLSDHPFKKKIMKEIYFFICSHIDLELEKRPVFVK